MSETIVIGRPPRKDLVLPPSTVQPTGDIPGDLTASIAAMKKNPFRKGATIPVTIYVLPPPAQTDWKYILSTANNGLKIKTVTMLIPLVATDKLGFQLLDDQKNKIFRTSQVTIVAAGPVTYAAVLYTGWGIAPAIQADNTIFYPLPDVILKENWRIQSAGTYGDVGDIFSQIVIYGEL